MAWLRTLLLRSLRAEQLPRVFWVLWAGAFLNRLGGFVVPFLSIFLTEQRGQSPAEVGWLLALYGLGGLAASLSGGALADRVGRRSTLATSLLLSAAAMGQLAWQRDEGMLGVSLLALGFFGELYRPALQAMVADLVPEGPPRVAAFGALYWAANLGFACSTMLAGLLASQSFRMLFLGDALTTLGFAAVALLLLPETRPVSAASSPPRALLSPFLDPRFVSFLVANSLLVLCFFQVNSTFPVAVRGAGLSTRTFGALLALNGVMIVVVQPLLTRWLGGLPGGRMLALGALLIGLGFGSHALASSAASWALGIVCWTLGEILIAPRVSAVVADLAPPSLRGSYQGALMFGHASGSFLGPLGGGWLLAHHGPVALWGGCGLAGLIACLMFLRRAR
ncbi:MAG: MFS transporter [Polyangiaceae bacterium]|jgi:MFS family permease|nr:MFS transporter [Polyangiaceae bacterium]